MTAKNDMQQLDFRFQYSLFETFPSYWIQPFVSKANDVCTLKKASLKYFFRSRILYKCPVDIFISSRRRSNFDRHL